MDRQTWAIIFCFVLIAACSEANVSGQPSQNDTETSYEDDTSTSDDSETFGYIGDSEFDQDSDTNRNVRTDSDSETDADSQTGVDSETGDDNDTANDKDSDSETDADTADDLNTGTGSDSETDPGPSPDSWKFAVMGNSYGSLWPVNTTVLSKLVKLLLKEDVDLVVFTGDTVLGTALLSVQLPFWVDTMKPLWNAGIHVYPTRGDRESDGLNIDSLGTWQSTFSNNKVLPTNGPSGQEKATYSKVHKNALFISLDQYFQDHRVPQNWLNGQLLAAEAPHIFVFGHEPAFKAQQGDCLDNYPNARDEFWRSLRYAGTRVYFCGHDRFYDHARVNDGDANPDNDIHQFIVGTAGASLKSWSPTYDGDNGVMTLQNIDHVENHGYLLVEVTGPHVELTWKGIDGHAGASWGYTVN